MGLRMESQQQVNQLAGGGLQLAENVQQSLPAVEVELVHLFDKIRAVKAFVFDVDGVLTNNDLLVTESGELLRIMNVRDGQAIKWAIQAGFPIAVITGGRSEGAKKRLTDLGVEEYYSGVKDKWVAFQSFLQRTGILMSEVCYMGDDLPDLPVLRKVGLACCPSDAAPEVLGLARNSKEQKMRGVADYISPFPGGKGCVRDIIEKVLKLQNKWPEY